MPGKKMKVQKINAKDFILVMRVRCAQGRESTRYHGCKHDCHNKPKVFKKFKYIPHHKPYSTCAFHPTLLLHQVYAKVYINYLCSSKPRL